MRLDPGTVAYWLEYAPGHDKFVYILGINAHKEVLSFTISSQTKYLSIEPHRYEMVEIPLGTAACFQRRSFIQCFFHVTRTALADFRDLESGATSIGAPISPSSFPE